MLAASNGRGRVRSGIAGSGYRGTYPHASAVSGLNRKQRRNGERAGVECGIGNAGRTDSRLLTTVHERLDRISVHLHGHTVNHL